MQEVTIYEDGIGGPLILEIHSDTQLTKLIEMVTIGNIDQMMIKQSDGRFYIKKIPDNPDNITSPSDTEKAYKTHQYLEFSRVKDPAEPGNSSVAFTERISFSKSFMVDEILSQIDTNDYDLYDDEMGEMNWIDRFGLHMQLDDGKIINVINGKMFSYDTYVGSESKVGNVSLAEYNAAVQPDPGYLSIHELDFLVRYNENSPIDSYAVSMPSMCNDVKTDIGTNVRYLLDDSGKLIMAYELDKECFSTTDLMADSCIVMKTIGETLYKLGSVDDLDGHVILLHEVHGGQPYAEYKSYEEFTKEYENTK